MASTTTTGSTATSTTATGPATVGAATSGNVVEDTDIIDTDTHVMEPPDLWTSRLSATRWGDDIPHVVFDERFGRDRWLIGGTVSRMVDDFADNVMFETDFPHPTSLSPGPASSSDSG